MNGFTSMAHRRRQPENREADHSEVALSPSARRESGFEGSEPRPGDRADADRAMDLLDRLDDVDARERQPKRSSDPLNRRRGPHHEGPVDRRRIKRLTPEDRREVRPMKQVAKLRFRIGQALPVWRAVRPRPDAPAGGNDHDHSSLRRGDAPQFFKQRVRPIGCLQGVSEQQPVDRAVGQRQHLRVDQRRGATPGFRPDRDALFRGHQGQASASAVAKSFEIGRAITHRGDGEAERCCPSAPGSRARSACGRRCRGASRRSSAS